MVPKLNLRDKTRRSEAVVRHRAPAVRIAVRGHMRSKHHLKSKMIVAIRSADDLTETIRKTILDETLPTRRKIGEIKKNNANASTRKTRSIRKIKNTRRIRSAESDNF
jgi:hypothetical protein